MGTQMELKKHGKKYCTECITRTGKYYVLKTLYVRMGNSQMKSGLYCCEKCNVIAIEDFLYNNQRALNNHIVKKLSTVIE